MEEMSLFKQVFNIKKLFLHLDRSIRMYRQFSYIMIWENCLHIRIDRSGCRKSF